MTVSISDQKAFDKLLREYEAEKQDAGELITAKVIYSANLDSLEAIAVTDYGLEFVTSSGLLSIKDYHEQDCCENVYADWLYLTPHIAQDFKVMAKTKFEVFTVEGAGFVVSLKAGRTKAVRWFVPCYNEQNGYYSSDLQLIVKLGDSEQKIDISEAVKDDIH